MLPCKYGIPSLIIYVCYISSIRHHAYCMPNKELTTPTNNLVVNNNLYSLVGTLSQSYNRFKNKVVLMLRQGYNIIHLVTKIVRKLYNFMLLYGYSVYRVC